MGAGRARRRVGLLLGSLAFMEDLPTSWAETVDAGSGNLRSLKEAQDMSLTANKKQEESFVCPPCEFLFPKAEVNADGQRVHNIEVHQRGEPKSGTTFMGVWARNAMAHACGFLNEHFGDTSCTLESSPESKGNTLMFNPEQGVGARCPCNEIDSAQATFSTFKKHELPISEECPYWHRNSISGEGNACSFQQDDRDNGDTDTASLEGYNDLAKCVTEAACEITDDRHQMIILRDPRPMTVSAFYHMELLHGEHDHGSLDDFVIERLPAACQWVALRHLLFEWVMPEDQATFFWYDDANEDVLGWHHRFYDMMGLDLPHATVEEVAQARADEAPRTINVHVGGEEATMDRTYEDELQPETLVKLDDILRKWLPPSLLIKFGVSP